MVLLNFCPDSNPGTFSLPRNCWRTISQSVLF